MKKIFTFISLFVLALGAQAQTTYNFSDATIWGENREFTADFTYGDVTLKAGDGKDSSGKNNESMTIDANNKTIDGIKCTRRVKTGGSTNTNGARSIAVKVAGDTKITIAAASSSGSAARVVFIATEPGSDETASTVLTKFENVLSAQSYSYTYKGGATTLYICGKGGGVNYYFIQTEDVADPSSAESKTWDFSGFENKEENLESPYDYDGLMCYMTYVATKDYIGNAGFHSNGTSTSSNRYMSFKPVADGVMTVNFKSNNPDDAANRTTAIATVTFQKNATAETEGVVDFATGEVGQLEANVTANTTYYIWFANGGQTVTKVTYTPSPTGVQAVKAAAQKTGVTYNLAGQQVGADYKGIVVKDGKKVMQ